MPSNNKPNNFNNPKGYALLVGINKFKNNRLKELTNCIPDVQFWKTQFLDVFDYEYVRQLTDEKATLSAFMAAVWSLAGRALPGDVVCITVSTHGGMSLGNNELFFYDQRISENIFNFLLKAFKPLVRIYIITDACHSGTFVENSIKPLGKNEIGFLKEYLKVEFPDDEEKINELISLKNNMPVSAVVAHLGAVNDEIMVPDGVLTRFCVSVPIRFEYINIIQLQTILYPMYMNYYSDYKFIIPLLYNLIQKHQRTKFGIDLEMEKANYYFYKSLIADYMKEKSKCKLLHEIFESYRNPFMSDEDAEEYFSIIGHLQTYYGFTFLKNPTVNFAGLRSFVFQQSKMFSKHNPKFINYWSDKYLNS
jgi:hypothetical protein